jgi:hypothetical protein
VLPSCLLQGALELDQLRMDTQLQDRIDPVMGFRLKLL